MAPNKLRQMIILQIEAGETKSDIAKALGINRSTVYKAIEAYKKHGMTDYLAHPGRPIMMTRRPSFRL